MSLELALQRDEECRAVVAMSVGEAARHDLRVINLHLDLRITWQRGIKRIEQQIAVKSVPRRHHAVELEFHILVVRGRGIHGVISFNDHRQTITPRRITKSPAHGRAFARHTLAGWKSVFRVNRFTHAVFYATDRVLNLAGCFLRLAFSFELAVAGRFACYFLDLAFGLLGRAFDAI